MGSLGTAKPRTSPYQPRLFLLAGCSRNDLIKQIEFLKVENEIMRKRCKQRVLLNPEEKTRLMKLGQAIGPKLRQFITIVLYDTFQEWLRLAKGGHVPKKMGRPRTAESIRNLIVKIAGETGWGYTRVMGEMKTLRIKPPSRDTVKRIMKEHKFDLGPRTGPDSWQEFLKHYHTERPHQGMGNVVLSEKMPEVEGEPPDVGSVVCKSRLGGLLKHYARQAA